MLLIAVSQDHDLARTEFDGLVEKGERQQIASEAMILVANLCRWRSLVGELRKDTSGARAPAAAAGLEQGSTKARCTTWSDREPPGETTERDY